MNQAKGFEEEKTAGDNAIAGSVLAPFSRPRKTVENWGVYKSQMGLGVEKLKDPWYFHRPVFNHLWNNAYLGVAEEDGAKAIERYHKPKQHLYYLSLLLHDALLQDKYIQAAYAMIAISQNPQSLPEQIWRCGMEILKKCPSGLMGTKRKFHKLMSSLCPQYSNQMVNDMAFQILSNGNDAREAYQFLISNINNKRVKYDVLFRAYIGMFEFVLWKINLDKVDNNDVDNHGKKTERALSENMSFDAKRALENMRIVLYEPGIWDCFVLKILEILEYYDNKEEAVSMLEQYREKNMNNPNAHRYLYLYMKKTNQHLEKQFDVLKNLMKMDITNVLVFDYIEMLKIKGDNCEIIEILFRRLDHCCCKDSVDDWQMLFMLIKSHKKHPSSDEWRKIIDCINERKSWWPKYHFTSNSNELQEIEKNGDDKKLIGLSKYKRRVGRYFEFKESNYNSSQIHSANEWTSDNDSNISEIRCKVGLKRHQNKSRSSSDIVLKKKKS